MGHDHLGHSYLGHDHLGHHYLGHNYLGHDHLRHNYLGHRYSLDARQRQMGLGAENGISTYYSANCDEVP